MLKRLRNIKFTTRLFIAIVMISIISVAVISGIAIRLSHDGLSQFGKMAVANTHQTVFDSIMMYDKNVRENLEGNLRFFKKEINSKGDVELSSSTMLKQTMVNQITKEAITKEIPRLVIGTTYMNGDSKFVDSIENTVGSSATIFQLVDDKLLRVSTTVKKLDGERAVGTYIPSDSAVYKAIMRGETFLGKAYVVNDWFLTAYAPLHDWDDKLVGALYVGFPLLNEQLKGLISSVKIGTGYFYMYGKNGNILFHPTLDEKSNIFDSVPELKEKKDGYFSYKRDGLQRYTQTAVIERWGVSVAVDLSEEDINGGLDKTMLQTNLIAGLVVVVAGILIAFMLVRSLNRPLRELAEKSIKVGEGDYTIEFYSENKDAIGQLTNALGSMVSKSKEMIEDIVSSSKTLRGASDQLLDVSEKMVANADTTTEIVEETEKSAQLTSGNIESISSAMEESSSNLEIIATASEEMGSTISDIAENSAKARATAEDAVTSAQKSHRTIVDLGEAANSIGTVTETITEISDQTNLLALNATIEAARAGDVGKGFAVVANEIKELAKQTAEATGEIKSAIGGIQSQTKETIADIEEITKIITEVNDLVGTIVTAVEEQAATTSEIASNVSQASTGVSEINHNLDTSRNLTNSMSEGVGQVKEKSLDVKSNSEEIRMSAASLSELSGTLTEFVARFRIE